MATIADLLIKISGDNSGLKKSLSSAQADMQKAFATNPVNELTGALNKSTASLNGFVGKIGTLSAMAAGGFGLGALIGGAVESGAKVYELSQRLSITTEEAGKFSKILKFTGGDVDSFASAMGKLNKTYISGGEASEKVKGILAHFGVSLTDSTGKLLPLNQQMEQLAKGFKLASQAGIEQEFILSTLGAKGLALIPTLNKYHEAVEKTAMLKGVGIDPKQMDELEDQMKLLQMQAGSLGTAFAGALAPVAQQYFPPIMEGLASTAKYLAENKEQLAEVAKNTLIAVTAYQGLKAGASVLGSIGTAWKAAEAAAVKAALTAQAGDNAAALSNDRATEKIIANANRKYQNDIRNARAKIAATAKTEAEAATQTKTILANMEANHLAHLKRIEATHTAAYANMTKNVVAHSRVTQTELAKTTIAQTAAGNAATVAGAKTVGAMTAAGIAARGLGASLLAALGLSGPVGLAIAGITAVGMAIYLIYDNWEPVLRWTKNTWNDFVNFIADNVGKIALMIPVLGPLLIAAFAIWSEVIDYVKSNWDDFIDHLEKVFDNAKSILAGISGAVSLMARDVERGISGVKDFLVDLRNYLPDWANSIIDTFSKMGDKIAGITASIGRTIRNNLTVSVDTTMGNFRKLEDTAKSTPITEIAEKGGISPSIFADADKAKKGKDPFEEMKRKAEQAHKAIEREWTQLTKTQLEQLNKWRDEQLKVLDETAAANADYEADKLKVTEVYNARYKKILEDRAAFENSIADKTKAYAQNIQKQIDEIGLKGAEKDIFEIEFRAITQFDEVEKEYRDLILSFESADAEQQAVFEKTWTENKILFETKEKEIIITDKNTGEEIRRELVKTVDFSRQKAKEIGLIEATKQEELTKYYKRGNDIRANIQAAYDDYDLAKYKEVLNAKNAAFLANLEGQKELMELHRKVMMDANMSAAQVQAKIGESFYGGLQEGIKGLIDGTKNWGEAFQDLGKTVTNVMAQMIAQMLAALAVKALFGAFGIPFAKGGAVGGKWDVGAGLQYRQYATGGFVKSLASGGAIYGAGTSTSDSIPAMLSHGEYVLQSKAVKAIGINNLDRLNSVSGLPRSIPMQFNTGGYVDTDFSPRINLRAPVLPVEKVSRETERKTAAPPAPAQSGSTTLLINTLDSRSFDKYLESSGGKALKKYFKKQAREFALPGR